MWNSLFHPSISFGELILRALAVYIFILFLLRISGKRQLGQLSAIEFVSILLISNAVQNSMNGGDNSLTGGMVLATSLICMSMAVSWFTFRYKKFRHWVEGVPTILVRKGKWIDVNLKREMITHEELRTMLRRQGIHKFDDIDLAILESDGTLTVSKVNEAMLS